MKRFAALLSALALVATLLAAPATAALPERVVLDLSFDEPPTVHLVESVSRLVLVGGETVEIRAITGELLYQIDVGSRASSVSMHDTEVGLATPLGIVVIDVMVGDVVATYPATGARSVALQDGYIWYTTADAAHVFATNDPESIRTFADPLVAAGVLHAIPRRPGSVFVENSDHTLSRLSADAEGIQAAQNEARFAGFDKISSVYFLATTDDGHLTRMYTTSMLTVPGTRADGPLAGVETLVSYDGLGLFTARPTLDTISLVASADPTNLQQLDLEPAHYGSTIHTDGRVITIWSRDEAYRDWGGSEHKLLLTNATYSPFPVTMTLTAYAHGIPGTDSVPLNGGCAGTRVASIRWERPLQFSLAEASTCDFAKGWAGTHGSYTIDEVSGELVASVDWERDIHEDTTLTYVDFYASAYTDWNMFVTEQFNAVLLRDPTSDERTAALAALALDDQAPESLAPELLASDEFVERRMAINRLYLAYFLRWPDADGEQYWTDQMAAGLSLDAVAETLASSAEFSQVYGVFDNEAFIDVAYQAILGHPGDADGVRYWTALLNNETVTRGQVIATFINQSDNRDTIDSEIVVRTLSVGLINQEPSLAFVQRWDSATRPAEAEALTAELLASEEYFDKFFYASPRPSDTSAAALVLSGERVENLFRDR